MVASNIFSIIVWFFYIPSKNVHQFTCLEQRATRDGEIHRLLQKCGSSVREFYHVTFLASLI
jgi:hypothetical protein